MDESPVVGFVKDTAAIVGSVAALVLALVVWAAIILVSVAAVIWAVDYLC